MPKNISRIIMSSYKKQFYSSADRNKDPILSVLKSTFSDAVYTADTCRPSASALEIASGTGQHLAYFAPHFPGIQWTPSEYNGEMTESITAYHMETKNMAKPWTVDVSLPPWSWPDLEDEDELPTFDLILNSNMVHIAPWSVAEGLFGAAGALLKNGGLLMTYGPYASDGVLTPDSNRQFDESLKLRDENWGIRDIEDLKKEAEKNGIVLEKIHDMPANNKLLAWRKIDVSS